MILLQIPSKAHSQGVASQKDQEVNVLKFLGRNVLLTFDLHSAMAEQLSSSNGLETEGRGWKL